MNNKERLKQNNEKLRTLNEDVKNLISELDVTAEVQAQTPIVADIIENLVGKATGADATAADIKAGKKAYVGKNLITGTYALPTLTNTATAADIRSGKQALDGDGVKITGTYRPTVADLRYFEEGVKKFPNLDSCNIHFGFYPEFVTGLTLADIYLTFITYHGTYYFLNESTMKWEKSVFPYIKDIKFSFTPTSGYPYPTAEHTIQYLAYRRD